MKGIKTWPVDDRPREKLLKKGARSLSNSELLAISFATYALVKHLEYRVKLQYKKLSPQVIRETLIRVQTSILYDKEKKIRYGLPSRISKYAQRIYQLLKINHCLTPYIIKKM